MRRNEVMATVQESIDMATVSREVAEAYADCWDYHSKGVFDSQAWQAVSVRRSLDFLASKWLARDEAQWVMQQWVKDYNGFQPDLLARLPAKALIRIAREGSVAIYVRNVARLPTARRMEADEKFAADLLGVICVRYWWD